MKLEFAISSHVMVRERLLLRGGRMGRVALPVRHGLLLRDGHLPVPIDTGYAPDMMTVTAGPALSLYRRMMPPRFAPDALPEAVLARHGVSAGQVSDLILTHLHADHVGGLASFPAARIHAAPAVAEMLRHRRFPARHGVFAELIPPDISERVVPFPAPDRELDGLGRVSDILGDGSVLAVPLPGHASGHCGLWFPDKALLYATDTAWTLAGLREDRERRLAVALVAEDRRAARHSAERVRGAMAAGMRVALCHDPAPLPEDIA